MGSSIVPASTLPQRNRRDRIPSHHVKPDPAGDLDVGLCQPAHGYFVGDHDWNKQNLDAWLEGPLAGKPVLIGSGMKGDRAAVVFARREEISSFIQRQCT